jgi:hypothetical protein
MKRAKELTRIGFVFSMVIITFLPHGLAQPLPSPAPEKNNTPKTQKLSIEDIRKNYKEERRKVTQAFSYESYLLVESKLIGTTAANRFELFNLETGTRTILPTSTFNVRLKEIKDENDFVFFADGTNAEYSQAIFPFILECQRNDTREPFCAIRKPAYLAIGQESSFGNTKNAVLLSIKVTLEGVEILFGPMKGKEGEFAAGYYWIPVTRTRYAAEKNQFTITFMGTKPDESISKESIKIVSANEYFSSHEVDEIDGNCRVTLNLTGEAKYYTGDIKSLKSSSRLPYVVISFAKEIADDE